MYAQAHDLLNRARAAKELSVQVAQHFDRNDLNIPHENLETSLQRLERRIYELKK